MADVGLLHTRRPAVLRRHVLSPRGTPRHAVLPPCGRGARRSLGATNGTQVLAQADASVDAVRKEMRLAESMHETKPRGCRGWRVPASARRIARRPAPAADALIEMVVSLRGFDPSGVASARRRSSPVPPWSSCASAARVGTTPEPSKRDQMAVPRWTRWPPAGSTTISSGGFCRYSTDARWLVPHFEKMLTDQALLARAYLHAWQDDGQGRLPRRGHRDPGFRPPGPLDARRRASTPPSTPTPAASKAAHATFTLGELVDLLPPATRANRRPNGTGSPRRATGRAAPSRSGRSGHLCARPPEIEEARALLAAARTRRVQPARDEKVLTEWNAMAVATLAEVAVATGNTRYGRGPRRSGSSSWSSMYDDGRLMRSWQGGRARHLAVAADHAWLVEACVRLSEMDRQGALWRARGRPGGAKLLDLFWDEESGGFFTTGTTPKPLIVRPKEFLDGALPSTNSIAVPALLRVNALGRRCATRDGRRAHGLGGRARCSSGTPGRCADLVAALPMLDRSPGDRDHRRPARPPGRSVPTLAARRRRGLGRGRRLGPLFDGPARRRPPTCAAGRACHAPADDPPTLGAARRSADDRGSDGSGTGTDGIERGIWLSAERTRDDAADDPILTRGAGTDEARPQGRRPERHPAVDELPTDPARLLRRSARRREWIPTAGGSTLHLLVLSSTLEDTTVVDLATRTVIRVRVPWPEDHDPDITAFDVVEVTLADGPRTRRPGAARGDDGGGPAPARRDAAGPSPAQAAPAHGRVPGRARSSGFPGRPPPTGSSVASGPRSH